MGLLPPYFTYSGKKVEPIKDLKPKNPGIYTENPGLRRSYFEINEHGIGTLNPILRIGLDS